MSGRNVKKYWDDLLQFKKLKEGGKEEFKKNLELFSKFLRSYDNQYKYNETFLSLFADDFLEFLRYFQLKYPLVKIVKEAITGDERTILLIDRYWKLQCGEDKKDVRYSVYENPDFRWVCSRKMTIECSLLVNAKHFLFHNIIDISDDLEENKIAAEKLKEELEEFIKKHTIKEED